MALVRWDPFRDFLSLQNELGRVFERTFGTEAPTTGAGWTPAVDVYEKTDTIVVKAELPEIDPKEVTVTYEDDRLIISGERKLEEEVKEEQYYRLERRFGSFRRTIPLPHDRIRANEIKAEYEAGVLSITIPKAEEVKPKQIKVEVEPRE